MKDWLEIFKYDPIPPLIGSKNEAISYFTHRDLLNEKVEPIETLWQLSAAQKILRKQRADGSWKYPGKGKSQETNYDVFHTIKTLRLLVGLYQFNKMHPAIRKAVDSILSFQTAEGDIRGIYGIQYSPNYSSVAIENIIKAGFEEDPRVVKFLDWILSVRQDDGGWAIPLRTARISYKEAITKSKPIQPVKSRPSSHWVTDLVLRALTAHPNYLKSKEAREAGTFLLSRFFKPDKYSDRRDAEYWTKFSYPFFWGDLLSSLNSLSLIGFSKDEPQIKRGLDWFIDRQESNGLWHEKMLMFGNNEIAYLWLSLAVCRVFKRFYTTR